ncbi:proteasome activator complex subunit 1 [Podarcis lilfordi]|uniref:Proteasome activator complex subunit 1 n=2 Tax=Podarcis lilfordi TaxID=74358 RepID=A0AA35PMJ3_9SAUR|nr:proteasome activator complex subunit 1 [Podarcis lilfordi]
MTCPGRSQPPAPLCNFASRGFFGVRPFPVATPKAATRHSGFAQPEPDAMATLEVSPECEAKVNSFKKELCTQAEELVARRFPEKIVELSNFLKSPELNVSDLISLRVELDIPIPDPKKDEERRKQREKEEKDSKKEEKDSKKSEDEDKAPPCGPVCHNEKITALLNRVKPEIQGTKEKLNLISLWLQLLVPRIEDGNNFGVAVQEKVYELLTSARTKLETFQTQIAKYYSERGDAVSKAAKSPHVGDYRQLVHEIDEAEYAEIRYMINELRNIYAVVYDITLKNFEKIKKPRDDNKGMIY